MAKRPRGATLGRHFAECQTPTLGKVPAQGGATWLLCRVPKLSAKSLPSVQNPTLSKDSFAVGGFAEWRLPSVTLGKEFAECKLAFAECNRHSAKPVNPVVRAGTPPRDLKPLLRGSRMARLCCCGRLPPKTLGARPHPSEHICAGLAKSWRLIRPVSQGMTTPPTPPCCCCQ